MTAKDVFGQTHEFKQEFTIFMDYEALTFHVTFGEALMEDVKAPGVL